MTRPIVLDTDMGSDVDDALCLALALASPELELVAITNVGRESVLRARIAKQIARLAGRADVPVYAGCRVPLLAGAGFNWFGHEGIGLLEPGEEPEIAPEHAVDALLELSRARPGLRLMMRRPAGRCAHTAKGWQRCRLSRSRCGSYSAALNTKRRVRNQSQKRSCNP